MLCVKFRTFTGHTTPILTGLERYRYTMQKRHILLISILLAVLFVSPVSAAYPAPLHDSTGIVITDCSVTPQVLMPGDSGIVSVTLTNTGTGVEVLNRAYIKVYVGEGMEMTSTDSYNLPRYINPGNSVTITMPIKAGEEAGIFYPVFNLVFSDLVTSLKQPLAVIVDDAGLSVTQTQVPESFPKTGSEQVVLTLANPMQTDITAVSVTAKGDGVSCKEGSVFVGTIPAGKSAQASITVRTDGAEDVTLLVSYSNGANKHTEELVIPAGEGYSTASPELIITNILVEKTNGYYTLTADVNNAGFSTANSLRISSLEGGDIGPYSTYVVGSLDGDDLAGFELTFKKPKDGTLTLVLTYKNDAGDVTEEECKVILENHMKPHDAGALPYIIGGIVILLILAAVIIRKKKAASGKNHE